MNPTSPSKSLPSIPPANGYDRLEWAGAFDGLGTLMSLVIAHVSVLKLDPFGVSMMVARSGAAVDPAAMALGAG